MSIPAIGAVSGWTPGLPGVTAVGGTSALTGTAAPGATPATGGIDFAAAIDQVQAMQSRSSELGVRAVTGDLDDVHDYTIASAQAGIALELTAAVRNKAIEAFTEIMRMQA